MMFEPATGLPSETIRRYYQYAFPEKKIKIYKGKGPRDSGSLPGLPGLPELPGASGGGLPPLPGLPPL
jgi:hypothetical protein